MHERFSDRARHALALANREAIDLGHDHLGPEHLLLGLLAERQSVGTSVLKMLDIDLDKMRAKVAEAVTKGETTGVGRRPNNPATKKVIDYAIAEARTLGHRYVGTEHLLLGLAKENGNVASAVLHEQGISVDKLREEVLNVLRAEVDELHDVARLKHGDFEWVHQQELAKAFRSTAFWHTMIMAVDSATRLGNGEVQPEHLLLALLRNPEGSVTRLLEQKGVTAQWVREELTKDD